MTQILAYQKWTPVAHNDIVGQVNSCHARGTYLIYGIIMRDLGIHLGTTVVLICQLRLPNAPSLVRYGQRNANTMTNTNKKRDSTNLFASGHILTLYIQQRSYIGGC